MYVKRIDIKKYRHIVDVSLGSFLRPTRQSDLIVLAGPNGGGKTSILELVSFALSNAWSLTYKLNRTAPESAFEVTLGLLPSELELIRADHLKQADTSFEEAYQYLLQRKEYSRSFNFPAGEYEKDPPLHNQMHNCQRRSKSTPLGGVKVPHQRGESLSTESMGGPRVRHDAPSIRLASGRAWEGPVGPRGQAELTG
jgi:hypothetical protein